MSAFNWQIQLLLLSLTENFEERTVSRIFTKLFLTVLKVVIIILILIKYINKIVSYCYQRSEF